MRSLRVVSALVVLTLTWPAPGRARVVESLAALVGDDIILQSEVEERALPLLAEIASIANPTEREARANAIRREVLERLVQDQLLAQQATELKLTVSSDEIDRAIEQIKRDYGLSDAQLKDELRKQGLTVAAYRLNTKREILKYRVLNIAVGSKINVGDSEVRSYYDRHMRSANVQVRASHIFVAIPEDADNATVVEREKLAKALLVRAQEGEDFAKLAREYSEDAGTRNDGGDLGFIGRDILPKPLEELVFSMHLGEIRGPVRADRGFHVIKLVDKRTKEAKPFADVEDEIRIRLRQREMERQTKIYLGELRKKVLVDIRL
ncbi:MAG: peptidylprolyl isomerase [Deltaproteobacteria bacterium]|nr:peptidylprolyl isomerase [Deltaproteobacteria bacterium]